MFALDFGSANYSTVTGGLSFSVLRRTALQNIAPRLGLSISALLNENLTESANQKFVGVGRIFLPGIGRNHSFRLTGAYQYEPLSNMFQELDNFQYSRGYLLPLNDDFMRFSIDYGIPLMYPDWGFGGIAYFKRIRANAFYDYGKASIDQLDRNDTYSSVGLEIIFDNVFFNVLPASVGFRASYLLNTDPRDQDATLVPNIIFAVNL